jgi:hypothetical protein
MSGCTTIFDHSYLFKSGNSLDHQIRAAQEIGIRFHASRGSMSLGESKADFLRTIVWKRKTSFCRIVSV